MWRCASYLNQRATASVLTPTARRWFTCTKSLGVAGFERLNSQYAFALWDARTQQLVLCRDRVGICPLHYTFDGETLYFASEVKALL